MRRRLRSCFLALLAGCTPLHVALADPTLEEYQARFAAQQVADALSMLTSLQSQGMRDARQAELHGFVANAAQLAVMYLSQSRSPNSAEALVDLMYLPLDGSLSRDVRCAAIAKGKVIQSVVKRKLVPPKHLCEGARAVQCRSQSQTRSELEQLAVAAAQAKKSACE